MKPVTNDLFAHPKKAASPGHRPLADRLRPEAFGELFGQDHVLPSLEHSAYTSLILWGPPGCGKTTLAKLIAKKSGFRFVSMSAVSHSSADIKKEIQEAEHFHAQGTHTLMLVDEIHRFNRTQQDLFLPYIENGTIILVGATTENPSFELNSALLSRCKVLVLKRLSEQALEDILARAEVKMGSTLPLTPQARDTLMTMADGDGRYLLNMAEELFDLPKTPRLKPEDLSELFQKRALLYDKSGDEHYNLISALHKSLRGSDVQAALYWFHRMLQGGEDPLYITRRLVRFAVEDIGLADPQALVQATAAKDAYDFLGSPEGELAITQCVIYLATAPKSNAAYMAHKAAEKDAKKYGALMPPKHILNAPTKLMKQEGYAKNYAYDHDTEHGFSGQNYFPDDLNRQEYYRPARRGFERELEKRLEYWNKLRDKLEHE